MLIRSREGAETRTQLRERLGFAIGILCAAFLVMIGRLWQLQVLRGETYFEETRQNVVDTRYLPSVRGKILDRKGRPLADNRPAFNLYAVPAKLPRSRWERLAALLDLDESARRTAEERLAAARERAAHEPALLLEDQGRERASLIKQEGLAFPGVEVRDEPYRHYPHGRLAPHLIGYMNQITPEELAESANEGYEPSEQVGRYGLERTYENYLRGKKGIERFVVNARGDRVEEQEVAKLIDGPRFEPPIPGHNVVTTIDLDLQTLVSKSLRRHAAGAVAVVEVDSGRILALASTPAFDSNEMTGHLTRAKEAQLLSDPRKPFIDKTLRQHYPPGSTYKFVATAAALESSLVDPEELLSCPGLHKEGRRIFHCTSSHEKLAIRDAIKHSCNVYFWKLAERVGIDRMAEVAVDFGFGAPTGLGLNGDVAGRVPTRAWYEERDTFKIGYTLNAAVGQGDVEVTVLQLAMAYAAIANGGELYVPQVVERIETADGEIALGVDPTLRRRLDVSPETLSLIREGMFKVVNERGGTMYKHGKSELVSYAGKTGTAQVRGRKRKDQESTLEGWHPHRDHAWFAGYAPADNPQIAVVVLIEHGGSGGRVAGPVAKEIVEGYLGRKITASIGRAGGIE